MKKRYIVVLILICFIAAAAFMFIRGRVQGNENAAETETVQMGSAVVCVFYANTFLSIDKEGYVCNNSSRKPDLLPAVEGVEFTKLAYGRKAQTADDGALDYVIKVALCLEKHGIEADSIYYSNRMISINIGKLEIQLGRNDKTEEKINDLNNFLDKVIGSSGTLYMQNANANNYGYTFRAD